jgi:hypothetical protein
MPDWIHTHLANDLDLNARWNGWWSRHENAADSAGQLGLPWLHRQFEATEILKLPLVGRYPFFDLRLIEFLMALPNFIRADKTVLREAMRGRLPEAVRTRAKTGAPGDLVRTMVANGKRMLPGTAAVPELSKFVMAEKFAVAWDEYCVGAGSDSTWASWLILQPLALGNWLSRQKELGNG